MTLRKKRNLRSILCKGDSIELKKINGMVKLKEMENKNSDHTVNTR